MSHNHWQEMFNSLEYKNYCDIVNQHFAVCKNKTVLEIGAFGGWHSKLILDQQPMDLTVVDPNIMVNDIINKNNIKDIVVDDVFNYLKINRKFDVVVCCGVLYHLHSPLYLLELISNMSNPDYIILDSYNLTGFGCNEEIDNNLGCRYTMNSWKSCKLNIGLPNIVFEMAMTNLGYKEIRKDALSFPNILSGSKRNSWMGLWEKVK